MGKSKRNRSNHSKDDYSVAIYVDGRRAGNVWVSNVQEMYREKSEYIKRFTKKGRGSFERVSWDSNKNRPAGMYLNNAAKGSPYTPSGGGRKRIGFDVSPRRSTARIPVCICPMARPRKSL